MIIESGIVTQSECQIVIEARGNERGLVGIW